MQSKAIGRLRSNERCPSRNPNFTAPSGKAATNCAAAWTPRSTRTTSSSCCSSNTSPTNAAGQKGYLLDVPKGGSFADMVALKGDKEIGDKINKIIAKLAEANDLKGVIDVADFNDADKLGKGKEMVDRLSNLVAIFDETGTRFHAATAPRATTCWATPTNT